MEITKYQVKSCCGRTVVIFKTNKTIEKNFLEQLKELGFKEQSNFTKSGILYASNNMFVITSTFGTTKLQIQCKKEKCENELNDLEKYLTSL